MSQNTKDQSKNQGHNKQASKVDDMKAKDEKRAADEGKKTMKKDTDKKD